jgi:hypothetical protein
MLRQLATEEADQAAAVLRESFDRALPTLAGLHTPDEDRWFFRERLFTECQIWGYFPNWSVLLRFAKNGSTSFTYCRHGKAVASGLLS